MILIDTSNIVNIALFAGLNPLDIEFREWKSKLIHVIMGLKQRFPGEEFIWCMDSWKNWRKEVYSEYKANRKIARDAQTVVDFKVFFPIKNSFLDQLQEIFSSDRFIQIEGAEADDIIAILSKTLSGDHTIVSTDKDFIQLLQYKNVKLWNPTTKQYRESLDPKMDLLVKIICGDAGDNVPQLQAKVGPKRALKLIESLDKVLLDPKLSEAFERNKILIDFEYIPESIKQDIINYYNSMTTSAFDKKKFIGFLMSIDMSLMQYAERWSELLEVNQ